MSKISQLFPGGKKSAKPAPRQPKSSAVEIVYGVDWYALDGIGTLTDQANKLSRVHKGKAYALFENQGQGADSLVGFIKAKVGQRAVWPAATLFAQSIKKATALYIGPDSTGQNLALIGLLQGMPSPSYDKVGSVAQILEAATEYGTYLTKGGELYVHESVGHIPEMGEFLERNTSIIKIVQALPGSELAVSNITQDAYRFKDAGTKTLTKLAWGVAGAVVLGGLAFAGWTYYSEQLEATERKKAQEKLDIKSYTASRDAAFNAQATLVASQIAPTVWNYVRQGKVSRAQWQLTGIDCVATSCVWSYAKKKDASFKGMVSTVSATQTPALELSKLDAASVSEAIPDLGTLPKLELSAIGNDPVTDLVVSFGSTAQVMQRAGLTVAIGEAGYLGDKSMAKKLKANSPLVRKAGVWTITGPSNTFVDAMRRMPGNATLSNVEFKLASLGDTFTAKGRYITK